MTPKAAIYFLVIVTFSALSANSYAATQILPLEKLPGGYLKLKAKINGIEGVFIIDTGATGSVIDTHKLAHFGLEISDAGFEGLRAGNDETGRTQTFPVKVNSVSLGNSELPATHLYANDMSGRLPSQVVGLIGQDVLNQFNALLDITKAELIIPESKPAQVNKLVDKDAYQVIKLQSSPMGFHYVDVALATHQVRLIIDTGAPEVVLDEDMLKGMQFKLEDHPTARNVIEDGVEIPMKVLPNTTLSIAQFKIKDDYLVSDFSALLTAINSGQAAPFVGVLGAKQLEKLGTIIDIAGSQLFVKPR